MVGLTSIKGSQNDVICEKTAILTIFNVSLNVWNSYHITKAWSLCTSETIFIFLGKIVISNDFIASSMT